jgi:SAM-dependent methyltransferase
MTPEERTQQLARTAGAHDPVGWFERLYQAAKDGEAVVPWDHGGPNPLLIDWSERQPAPQRGRALVVGSGLGDDAELLAGRGFDTVGFDVSETAIASAHQRYPDSVVDYRVASLLEPPAEFAEGFDFVLESLTVQALPEQLRSRAIAAVRSFVAPGGRLLVIQFAREDDEPPDGPPWPLTRAQLDSFGEPPLHVQSVEQHTREDGRRIWRALYSRD